MKCMMDGYQSELLSLRKGALITKTIKNCKPQEKIERCRHILIMLIAMQKEYALA